MPKPAHEKLAAAIARAERRGVTRYALSRDSGVNRQAVTNIANGDTVPRMDTAEKLAEALGYRIELVPLKR